MAQSVEPILLDSTGQDIVDALNLIAEKTIDSELSTTSVHSVENRVITNALNGKQATLTWDGNYIVI